MNNDYNINEIDSLNIIVVQGELVIGRGMGVRNKTARGVIQISYFVDMNMRNRGIGTAIVRHLISLIFRNNDVSLIEAHVDLFNVYSTKVLIKNGFNLKYQYAYNKDGLIIEALCLSLERQFY